MARAAAGGADLKCSTICMFGAPNLVVHNVVNKKTELIWLWVKTNGAILG